MCIGQIIICDVLLKEHFSQLVIFGSVDVNMQKQAMISFSFSFVNYYRVYQFLPLACILVFVFYRCRLSSRDVYAVYLFKQNGLRHSEVPQ